MDQREFIDFLNIMEMLKCNTRHSWTSTGRHESVAEHSWRLALMVLLCSEEYPELDMNKVIKMCIIHDFGEAITGDIPSFFKNEEHEDKEDDAIDKLLTHLPKEKAKEFKLLFDEMDAMETQEAKLVKALDNMEAVVSHNEAPIDTWIPLEYEENLRYGNETAAFSPWTRRLREVLREDSLKKIEDSKKKQ